MGKKRTYRYLQHSYSEKHQLVTSKSGRKIPANCEVTVVFSDRHRDDDINYKMAKLINGEIGYSAGIRRYVLVCGEKVPIKIQKSYNSSFDTLKEAHSLPVERWLNGEILQTGEQIESVASTGGALPSQPQPMSVAFRSVAPMPQSMGFAPQPTRAMPPQGGKVALDVWLRSEIIDRVITEQAKNTQVAPDNNDLLAIKAECFGQMMEAINKLKDEYKSLAHKAELKCMMERKEALDKELEILTKKVELPRPRETEGLTLGSADATLEREIGWGDNNPRNEKRKAESLNPYGWFSPSVLEPKRVKSDDPIPAEECESEDEIYLVIDDYDEDEDENTTPGTASTVMRVFKT